MPDQIIHVVLGKANPNRMNGVNKVVNSLASAQQELTGRVELWGITRNLEVNYPERNYPTVLFHDKSKWQLDPQLCRKIQLTSRQTVFHLHGGFLPQLFMVACKLRQAGRRFVYTPHGAYNTVALGRSALKKKVYLSLFEKVMVKAAKCIHFIGRSEINGAERVFGQLDYCLVPNGQKLSNRALSFNPGQMVFAFVGRLDLRTKGLDLLLKGFAGYSKQASVKPELRLIGDGPDRSRITALAKELGVINSLKFMGACFGPQKEQALEGVDTLCLTSRNEGMPGVVLEAAAKGLPVLVSPETNLSDYIRLYDCGVSIAENTPHEIARGLFTCEQAKRFDQLHRWGHNARTMIRHEFNWDHIAQQLIAVYAA